MSEHSQSQYLRELASRNENEKFPNQSGEWSQGFCLLCLFGSESWPLFRRSAWMQSCWAGSFPMVSEVFIQHVGTWPVTLRGDTMPSFRLCLLYSTTLTPFLDFVKGKQNLTLSLNVLCGLDEKARLMPYIKSIRENTVFLPCGCSYEQWEPCTGDGFAQRSCDLPRDSSSMGLTWHMAKGQREKHKNLVFKNMS